MVKQNEVGSAATVLAIVLLSLGLVGSAAFGYWAFTGRQDYKNNVDKKVTEAVAEAEKAQTAKLQQEFDEKLKDPHATYQGPATYGTITLEYPRTWSAYVDEVGTAQPINGYFHPQKVPSITSSKVFALRVELVSTAYNTALQQYDPQIKAGKLKAVAYLPAKLKDSKTAQPGVRLDGELSSTQKGSMVMMQVRDKTLKIYTLSPDYTSDFNSIVLPSLTFTP